MNIITLISFFTLIVSAIGWSYPHIKNDLIGYPYAVHYHKEWYRIFTSGFLHADLFHFFFNMYALLSFGGLDWFGFYQGSVLQFFDHHGYPLPSFFLLFIYLGGILVTNLLLYLQQKENPHYLHLGASAGVCALMAAHTLLFPGHKVSFFLFPLPLPSLLFLIGYLTISFLYRNRHEGISHLSHVIGSLYGILLMFVLAPSHVVNNIKAFVHSFFI